MIKKISTLDMSREDWLKERRNAIGGSDAGAILGLNPYSSPTKVFLDKTGKLDQQEDTLKLELGRELEDLVAKRFERETGKKVRRRNAILVNDAYPFAHANVDREIVGENALLECKTTSYYKPDEFAAGNIPDSYKAQCFHYMAVTGAERVYLAMLFIGFNTDFKIQVIERDEDEIDALMMVEEMFWNDYVLQDEYPPADGSVVSNELLTKVLSESDYTNDSIDLSDMDADLLALDSVKEQIKALETEKRRIESELKIRLESASQGESELYKATFKSQTRTTVDAKKLKEEWPDLYDEYKRESTSRVLRIRRFK